MSMPGGARWVAGSSSTEKPFGFLFGRRFDMTTITTIILLLSSGLGSFIAIRTGVI